MFLKVFFVLVFVGILTGLARLFKSEEIDLDNKKMNSLNALSVEIIFQETFR